MNAVRNATAAPHYYKIEINRAHTILLAIGIIVLLGNLVFGGVSLVQLNPQAAFDGSQFLKYVELISHGVGGCTALAVIGYAILKKRELSKRAEESVQSLPETLPARLGQVDLEEGIQTSASKSNIAHLENRNSSLPIIFEIGDPGELEKICQFKQLAPGNYHVKGQAAADNTTITFQIIACEITSQVHKATKMISSDVMHATIEKLNLKGYKSIQLP